MSVQRKETHAIGGMMLVLATIAAVLLFSTPLPISAAAGDRSGSFSGSGVEVSQTYAENPYDGCAGAGYNTRVARHLDGSGNYVYTLYLQWRGDYSQWFDEGATENITSSAIMGGNYGRDTVRVRLTVDQSSPHRSGANLLISNCKGDMTLPAMHQWYGYGNAYLNIFFAPMPPDAPPPPPPPPPAAAPTCSVTFDTNPINGGEGTVIRWVSSNVEWMYINSIGYVTGSGSAQVAPSQTTNYDGSAGDTESVGTDGSQTYSTPGTHSFAVPANYTSLTVKVWGGGGGGGNAFWDTRAIGISGGQSSFNGTVTANGGGGGNTGQNANSNGGGAGGTASGGTTNTSGNNGVAGCLYCNGGAGGSSPNGGAGGAGGTGSGGSISAQPGFFPEGSPPVPPQAGGAPGGGGGGASNDHNNRFSGGGGGGGGYSTRTYSAGQLPASVTVVVGAGGTGYPASGGAGRVEITWTAATGGGDEITTATCPATLTVNAGQCPAGQHTSGSGCLCDGTNESPVGGQCGGGHNCPSGQTWNGFQCSSGGCALGWTGTPPTCSFAGCPADHTLVSGQCVPDGQQCAPFYCDGSDLYQNNAQCVGTFVQGCAFGCSGGGCLAAPTGTGTITATPSLVQHANTARVAWTTEDMEPGSCSVGEDNPLITDGGAGENGSFISSPLEQRTIFTLICTDLGSRLFTDSVVVNIIPRFEEQ